MSKRLTRKSTLENLKIEAKRRLKAMRATDPDVPLRAAQHAVALDYGFDGWPALKEALAAVALSRLTDDERADILLRPAWYGDSTAQARILARHPRPLRDDLITAIAFGDLARVRQALAEDPGAADRKAGPLDWEPILYLAFSRLPVPAASENAVAIAEALLDAGANPNAAFDDGWGNPFKPITGVIGHGEGVRPVHPQADALVDLLLARGADPFDTQALYDTSIVGDDVAWMARLYEACAARGQTGRWETVGQGLGGRLKLPTLDYLLGNAVAHSHAQRVRWLVAYGADPNSRHAYSGLRQHTHALVNGLDAMAALLVSVGATPEELEPGAAFQVAALRRDRRQLEALLAANPDLLRSPEALAVTADKGRVETVALLLDLGQSADLATHDGWRPLHRAARNGSVPLARLLLAAGAEIDARESNYDSTPLGGANFFRQRQMVELLAPLSRDVFALASAGQHTRLDEVLRAEPGLANAPRKDARTPLFHLPDDEDDAAGVTRILLRHGADPAATNAEGLSAARAARQAGLDEAADLMDGLAP